ncbi:hypothetical protein LTS18_011065, partial [Coniosporium uncinatum]
MDENFLAPARAAGTKFRQVQDAKEMQQVIADKASFRGKTPPAYEFLELIGKGSYGRIYKCEPSDEETAQTCNNQKVVAVKILEVDRPDYQADLRGKDDTIRDFIKETQILRQLRDSKAKNVNHLYDAFDVDDALWIILEYCPGGSVKTLMKASTQPGRLEEEYIIPIARELAVALKDIHDAGIVHRDIKCANILIREDGLLQLCDFGVAATLESRVSKRTTIIGTPHYMPLELVSRLGKDDPAEINKFNYGTEVDIWSYGIAVYEMATGQPPNAMTRINHLPDVLERAPPRLEGGDFSDELREFIAFCLEEDPNDRPSAETLLEHEYIASSARTHPTHKLAKLVTRFVSWEHRGGQRASLFVGGGAEFPEPLSSAKPDPDWNFSTTEEFDMQFEDVAANFDRSGESAPSHTNGDTDSITPRANQRRMPPWEKAKTEERIRRGQRDLGKLFDPDPNASPYKYGDAGRRSSDLPLRNFSNEAGDRTTMIDLDDIGGSALPTIDLGSIPTYRGNRTNRWSDASDDEGTYQPNRYSKRMTREWTFPKVETP